jgi:hypothetical protein
MASTPTLLALPLLFLLAAQDGPPEPKPEDFPEALRPYLELADGLEDLERSLTLQLAVQLGMVRERAELPAAYRKAARRHRENWNEELAALVAELGPRARDGEPAGGALFYDTGVDLDRERRTARVLREPEIRLVADERYGERTERRELIARYPQGLEPEDAERLDAILEKVAGPLEERDNPWLVHASTHLVFMSLGAWEDYARPLEEKGTPFGTMEEFLARIQKELRVALVDPLTPRLDEADREDRNFRYEGELVVLARGDDDEWEVPEELLATNALDRVSVLVLQVPAQEEYGRQAELDYAVLGLIAGGEHRLLYEGPLPIE